MIQNPINQTVTLENFEGPIELLIYLAQKQELSIYEISIQKILHQFIEKIIEHNNNDLIDNGSDIIVHLSSLMLLKSRLLLPRNKIEKEDSEEKDDFTYPLEALQHLWEYCKYKGLSEELSKRFDEQQSLVFRGSPDIELPKPPPTTIRILPLEELSSIFSSLIHNKRTQKGTIKQETWRVKDKIQLIQKLLKQTPSIPLEELFPFENCKLELIVTFLALLELMKQNTVHIEEHQNENKMYFVCLTTHREINNS